MAGACTRRTAGCFLLALAVRPIRAHAGEDDRLLATVDKPASFTALWPSSLSNTAAVRVIISVTRYHPSDDGGPIEVVVRGRIGDGAEHLVGSFGITPDREFSAALPDAQRFSMALPSALANGKPIIFSLHLIPIRGEGRGAFLRIGEINMS